MLLSEKNIIIFPQPSCVKRKDEHTAQTTSVFQRYHYKLTPIRMSRYSYDTVK